MNQFATAWITENITSEPLQVLVFLWREADLIRARHYCATNGSTQMYMEWTLQWTDKSLEDGAGEYLAQCKIEGSETRADVEEIFKKQLQGAK